MRRLYAAGLATTLALGVAACGSDDPEPNFADPTPSPTESTSAPSPESEPTAPNAPEEASETTEAGAIAFTRYFWEVANYAQQTGDTTELERITNSNCVACQGAIKSVKDSNRPGVSVKGGRATVTRVRAETFTPAPGESSATVTFSVRNTKQRLVRDGKTIETYNASTVDSQFLLTKNNRDWRVDVWTFPGD